jgi:hypothetical protein
MSGAIDWMALETTYRAGKASNRELARRFGCSETAIRKRALKEGWTRAAEGPAEPAPKPPDPPTLYPALTKWIQRRAITNPGPAGPPTKE